MGVFGEPELILVGRGDQPFEEVCTKPSLKAATHDTDLRQKIPNVSAFEWRGDNENHWSLAVLRVLVGWHPGGGYPRNDAMRCLVRSYTNGIKRPADLPPGFVIPLPNSEETHAQRTTMRIEEAK